MKIKTDELRRLIKTALLKKYPTHHADLIADVIMFGEMSGKTSHGIVRLMIGQYSVMAQEPKGEPELVHKTKVSTIIESNGNPGMLVGPLAMTEVIRLGKENGIGVVGTRDNFGSSGCLSYYLEKIAKENLICVVMAQSPPSTAPYGGVQPLFGTNPISFGIPAHPKPLIFDMATSAIAFGAMVRARELGLKLPENVAVDKDGNATTDPVKAIEGATLAFDNSYKGCGLAMMVEILAGIWPGADYAGLNIPGGWGNVFMVFSPDLLTGADEFKKKAEHLIETVRNSKTKDGSKVRIPGENTIRKRDECLRTGEVEVDEKLVNQLKEYITSVSK
jgi:LDH2 family malate/lactate/ureidoglycolate dehydrogenase